MTDSEYEDPEYEELKAEARAERRYHQQFCAHPDPRDPDYPGDRDE